MVRRYGGLNPDSDPAAIYVVDNFSGTRTLTKFTSLANPGTIATNAERQLGADAELIRDPLSFAAVGKVGIGDIDVNTAGTSMYVANLNTRDVVHIDVATKAETSLGLPAVTSNMCAGTGVARVWGLKVVASAVGP